MNGIPQPGKKAVVVVISLTVMINFVLDRLSDIGGAIEFAEKYNIGYLINMPVMTTLTATFLIISTIIVITITAIVVAIIVMILEIKVRKQKKKCEYIEYAYEKLDKDYKELEIKVGNRRVEVDDNFKINIQHDDIPLETTKDKMDKMSFSYKEAYKLYKKQDK